ncbi:hypothetical protein P22_3600 [Propionispora sp. 2/2-37]|uniref:CvfB family protein n=1 Tax=Propionispora sp. 2/2-37 TaxID=1677858 RepID=UPI0006BB68B3|nr:S1-like domain-containing RNA-binding protein [Propionispora sp. 2/2-37]CUH97470.1 hypothetical protein P22_3600 [Propionispora sp. 2/2-37]
MKSIHSSLKPGNVVSLRVVRMNELGAFLDAGTGNTSDDILLHKAQQMREININEQVEVYLYLDPKGRLTASMRLPQMREGQVARVVVINTTRDGAFVNIGAERGVFLPFSEMHGKVRKGDKIWVKLYRDKSDRMAVTMDVAEELQKASKPAVEVKVGDFLNGVVYNQTEEGIFLFTQERYIAFLHTSETTRNLRIGDEVIVRVTYIREDGRLNVSMRPVKQEAQKLDAQAIWDLLDSCDGKIPYTDDTPAEVIKEKFGISKSAFKRAMGSLLKAQRIEQKDGWTYKKNPI